MLLLCISSLCSTSSDQSPACPQYMRLNLPFEEQGERGEEHCSSGIPVDRESVMAHAAVKSRLGDYGQTSIPKLQQDDPKIWLRFLQ
ncbi:unnamed protein product [Cuscuta campestris]|uniref:Uncharacterized protein n=1 Tax=Cuscuta campestris TaxID=132261 RepID=A0A484LVN2_9ASTE|nr:unnamed protein product [Cuscuta campestris]